MELFNGVEVKELIGTPLAEKLRPKNLEGVLGQDQAVATVRAMIKRGVPGNLIFSGPPGTGKTTLAEILASKLNANFVRLNATESGIKELRQLVENAKNERRLYQKQTVLFLDEIHRWSKSQQDVLLPYLEKGDIVVIGATTESPSHSINPALLSRCQTVQFYGLAKSPQKNLIQKVIQSLNASEVIISDEIQELTIQAAAGDARRLISSTEALITFALENSGAISVEQAHLILKSGFSNVAIGETLRHDLISALIKSLRGSDPDASLYYLARLIKSGEDPRYIARRLVIFASEDIGNADTRALTIAVSCFQATEVIGLPEVGINLSHVVSFLACCPKSNRTYLAWKKALTFVEETGSCVQVPIFLRSAVSESSREKYLYPHDFPKSWVEQNYWPKEVTSQVFYEPLDRGNEKTLRDYQSWLKTISERKD